MNCDSWRCFPRELTAKTKRCPQEEAIKTWPWITLNSFFPGKVEGNSCTVYSFNIWNHVCHQMRARTDRSKMPWHWLATGLGYETSLGDGLSLAFLFFFIRVFIAEMLWENVGKLFPYKTTHGTCVGKCPVLRILIIITFWFNCWRWDYTFNSWVMFSETFISPCHGISCQKWKLDSY